MIDDDVITRLVDLHDHIKAPFTPSGADAFRGERLLRRRRTVVVGAAAAAVVAVVGILAGTTAGERALPAKDPELRNGQIIHTGGERDPLLQSAAPALPSAPPYPQWEAYDPDSGSFLYLLGDNYELVTILDGAGAQARFTCPASATCTVGGFGPGPDEVTAAGNDAGPTVEVIAFDGTVRDTLDLSAAVTGQGTPADPGQRLGDLAWSPDESRLAVSTEPTFGCDPTKAACEARVWLFDRDGGEPRLVYTEHTPGELVGGESPNTPVILELAWSPDGSRLGIVVGNHLVPESGQDDASQPLPRLIAVPAGGGDAQTLFTYDNDHHPGGFFGNGLSRHFAFAWSPDGNRIAVTSKGGIAEISATNGAVLAEHPGKEVHGPIAWLPKRPVDVE